MGGQVLGRIPATRQPSSWNRRAVEVLTPFELKCAIDVRVLVYVYRLRIAVERVGLQWASEPRWSHRGDLCVDTGIPGSLGPGLHDQRSWDGLTPSASRTPHAISVSPAKTSGRRCVGLVDGSAGCPSMNGVPVLDWAMLYRAVAKGVLFGGSLLTSVACGARTELPDEQPGLFVQDTESNEAPDGNDVSPDGVTTTPMTRPGRVPGVSPPTPGSGMRSMPDPDVNPSTAPDLGPMMGTGSTVPGVDVTSPVSGPTAASEMPGPMTPAPPDLPLPPPMEGRPPCNLIDEMMVHGNDVAQFPGVSGIRVFADGSTTTCIIADEPGRVCMFGRAADAGPDYANWGALLTMSVATEDANGRLMPFDAQALGIVAIELEVLGVDGGPALRALVQMPDDPDVELASNYGANAFVFGSGMELSRDGTYAYPFQALAQPPWSNLDLDGDGLPDMDTMFDPSRVQAIQVQVVTSPGIELDYDFCITGLRWLDRAGAPVTVDSRIR